MAKVNMIITQKARAKEQCPLCTNKHRVLMSFTIEGNINEYKACRTCVEKFMDNARFNVRFKHRKNAVSAI